VAKLSLKDLSSESALTINIRRVHRLLTKRVQSRFAESDRGLNEWMALRLFADGHVETAGDLARELDIATGATTRLIDSLEARGFVERDAKDGDRRVVLVRLTRKGLAYFKSRLPALLECWNELLVDWKDEEVKQLTRLLDKLHASLAGAASSGRNARAGGTRT